MRQIPVLLLLAACNGPDDTDKDTPTDDTDTGTPTDETGTPTGCAVTPGAWSAPEWDANTAEAIAIREQLATLVGVMGDAEDGVAVVDGLDDLTGPYEAGDPSLSGLVSPGFSPVVDDAFAEFVELAGVGPLDLFSDDYRFTPGAQGGITLADQRGINEGGLEIRQVVDKGLFAGGAFYPYAVGLTTGDIQPATVEAIAAIWGADATLSATSDLDDSANYSEAMGFFPEIADNLAAAHAYAADPACTAERDEALVTAFRAWELSMMARFVYYANAASVTIGAPTSPDDLGGALHELAEGLGLAMGFHGVVDPTSGPLAGQARTITDADIATMMGAMGVDLADLGASTTGTFVEDPTAFATAVADAEAVLKTVYGLTDEQLQDFRAPAPE